MDRSNRVLNRRPATHRETGPRSAAGSRRTPRGGAPPPRAPRRAHLSRSPTVATAAPATATRPVAGAGGVGRGSTTRGPRSRAGDTDSRVLACSVKYP